MMNAPRLVLTIGFAQFFLGACKDSLPSYLLSQGLQQGSLYLTARPIQEVLDDPGADPEVKRYLLLSREVLNYAEKNLEMKTGGSYQTYAALRERWVSHVVVAAHKDRLEPYLFRYPLFGGLPYRGYFKLRDAVEFANRLRQENLDVHVRPVPAYSTTGWLPDPIVTSMFGSESEFIEVLFHELVHIQFYLSNEADFNEAFATWFAQGATKAFIQSSRFSGEKRASMQAEILKQQAAGLRRTREVQRTIEKARRFYASPEFIDAPQNKREALRSEFFDELASSFANEEGLDRWSKIEWNNAVLVSLSTYYDLVSEIDSYAKRKGFDERALLKAIIADPKLILSELELKQAQQASLHSAAQSPPAHEVPSDPLNDLLPQAQAEPMLQAPQTL